MPILLVDDDNTDALLFRRAFEQLKMENLLIHLIDCKEALKYLGDSSKKKPYIIFTDLNMPKMFGLEFLREIKADEALRHIIVIVLSGSGDEADVAESFRLGAAGYMVKPPDHKKLIEMIRAICEYWSLSELPRADTKAQLHCPPSPR